MDNKNIKVNSLDAQHLEELEAARLRISQLEDTIKAKDKALLGLDERVSGLDKAWGITKIILTLVSSIMIPLFAFLISLNYNKSQLEITAKNNANQIEMSREKFLAEKIIPMLASKELDARQRKAIAVSLAIFEKPAISPLITFLEDDDVSTRKAAASALMMIGKEVIEPLGQFILNRVIHAKYKGEAIAIMENLDKSKRKKVTAELLWNMQTVNVFSGSKIRDETHPFIARETVIALYSLGADLSNTFLENIDLSGASLERIKLKGANLKGANFSKSKLMKADLSSANLDYAVFNEADISGAVLKDASCNRTKWEGTTTDNVNFDFDTCIQE